METRPSNLAGGPAERLEQLEQLYARLENRMEQSETHFANFSAWATRNILTLQRICERLARNDNSGRPVIKIDHEFEEAGDENSQHVWMSSDDFQTGVNHGRTEVVESFQADTGVVIEEKLQDSLEEETLVFNTRGNNSGATGNDKYDPTGLETMETTARVETEANTNKDDASSSSQTQRISIVPNPVLWKSTQEEIGSSNPIPCEGESSRSSSRASSLRIVCDEEDDPEDGGRERESRRDNEEERPGDFPPQRRHRRKVTSFICCDYCGKKYKQLGSLFKHLRYCGSQAMALFGRFQTGMPLAPGIPGMALAGPSRIVLPRQAVGPPPGAQLHGLENLIHARPNVMSTSRSVTFEQGHAEQQFPMECYAEVSTCQFHCRVCGTPYASLSQCRQHIIAEHFDEVLKTPACITTAIGRTTAQGPTPPTDLSSTSSLVMNALSSSPFPDFQGQRHMSPGEGRNFNFSAACPVPERRIGLQPSSTASSHPPTPTPYPAVSQTLRNIKERPTEVRHQAEPSQGSDRKIYYCVYCKTGGQGSAEFDNLSSLQSHVAKHHFPSTAPMQPHPRGSYTAGKNLRDQYSSEQSGFNSGGNFSN